MTQTKPPTAAIAPADKVKTFRAFVESRSENLAQVLPDAKRVERLINLAVKVMARPPAYAGQVTVSDCTFSSVYDCINTCAELGLDPTGTLGGAYLIPFKDNKSGTVTCTLIIGYRGMVELARRSGEVLDVEARAVYSDDFFEIEYGMSPRLIHKVARAGKRTMETLTDVYCVVTMRSGAKHIDHMTRSEVDAIRKRSRSGDSGPWATDYAEQAKKTVVRRTMKLCPLSPEVASGIDMAEHAESIDGEVLSQTWAEEPKHSGTPATQQLKATIAKKAPAIIDVKPGETEEQATKRVTSTGEPPDDVVLPGQREPGGEG